MTPIRAAHTIESERVRLENYAVDAVARVGDTALRHAAAAVRLGSDPVNAARDVLWGNPAIRQPGLEDLITRALVASHLLGLRRTALAARQHYGREVLTLSRAGDKLNDWLGKLVDVAAIAEGETAGLFQRARAAAARIVQRITAPLFNRVAAAPGNAAALAETTPTPRAVAVELRTQFEKAGFVPGAEHGIATVLGGAMVRGYESGRARGWRTPQIQEKLWGLRYSAILDSRTTELCRGLDGTVLPLGDPFFSTWTPPNHFNCFLPGTSVEGSFVGGLKAFYAGQVVEINTARGHRLTVTANHPVLTARGWVTAASLNEGDDVLSRTGDVEPVTLGVVNDEQRPSRVEDVFEAMRSHARRFRPVSLLDLYGDGRNVQGDVEVVSLQRGLLSDFVASFSQRVRDVLLIGHDLEKSLAECLSLLDLLLQRHLPPLCGGPCGGALALNGFSVFPQSFPLHPFGRGLTTERNPVAAQACQHGGDGSTKALGERFGRLPAFVSPHHFGGVPALANRTIRSDGNAVAAQEWEHGSDVNPVPLGDRRGVFPCGVSREDGVGVRRQSLRCGLAADWDVPAGEKIVNGVNVYPELARKLVHRSAGNVAADQIVRISRREFSGHVYDLQSETGWILSEGIVTSNCRSLLVEVWESSRLRHPPAEVRNYQRFGADFFMG